MVTLGGSSGWVSTGRQLRDNQIWDCTEDTSVKPMLVSSPDGPDDCVARLADPATSGVGVSRSRSGLDISLNLENQPFSMTGLLTLQSWGR